MPSTLLAYSASTRRLLCFYSTNLGPPGSPLLSKLGLGLLPLCSAQCPSHHHYRFQIRCQDRPTWSGIDMVSHTLHKKAGLHPSVLDEGAVVWEWFSTALPSRPSAGILVQFVHQVW